MARFDVTELARRYEESCSELEEVHLDWTLDISMDDETADSEKPSVLSPFLPSQSSTLSTMINMLPELGPEDCLIDVGCGDGRVLVAATRLTGCRGVGVDVSPDCIKAAKEMMVAEDSSHAAMAGERAYLKERLSWLCADCTLDKELLGRLVAANRGEGKVYLYLYIYPTLLDKLRPEIEALSYASSSATHGTESEAAVAGVVTARYHFEGWKSGFVSSKAPPDLSAGPNEKFVEVRRLNPLRRLEAASPGLQEND